MASDITTTTTQEDSRRKHRQSPDDEPEESPKRHKHRHHHHRSRNHRHRSKKHEKETKNEDDGSKHGEGDDVNSPKAPSTLLPVGVVSGVHLKIDYDMEEGEIVEDAEEVFGDQLEKKKADTAEFEPVVQNLGVQAECGFSYLEAQHDIGPSTSMPLKDCGYESGRVSKTVEDDRNDGDFLIDAILDKKDKRTNQFCNSSKIEDVFGSGNSNAEHYGIHVNGDFSWGSRTKGNTLANSVFRESGRDNVRSRSRSRSHDSVGDRSRSQSVVKEVSQSENMHDSWDGKKKVRQSRDHRRGSNDLVRDDEKESITIFSIHAGRQDRDQSLETWSGDREGREMYRDGGKEKERDRSMDKDKRREREREMSKDREKERERRAREKKRESRDRYTERERSRDRHIDLDLTMEKEQHMSRDKGMDLDRRRETEWGRSRGMGIYKDRQRESERDRSRDRFRERDRDRERGRVRETDRDRDWAREREKDSGRDRNRDKGGDRASYMDYIYDETEDHRDRTRRNNLEKVHSSKSDFLKEGEDKRKRDEDEQEDYQERISLQLAEQEEEDIDRIKEESRRRRQAILEKYKSQQIQEQVSPHLKDAVKDERIVVQVDQLTIIATAAPEIFDVRNDDADAYVADQSFSVGKSPPQNGLTVFERSSGAGGLGEGTPKSERSNDMFCDDIFGDSPAGVHKLAKGDGLPVEKSGLHDNWDDAEGYYSYRFGENLDGRYEITAAHGKGVFSNVVRAKDVKAGNGEPEEVAIKIIRNNETMYKAGQSELIILKKLVGADPENKRHCVRFLSSFKYRNHLCLVFESLHMNLREVLKKFGRNIGLKLTAVRAYAKQLFIALKHLRNCGVLHCDIKPDNMLVNEAKNVLKLCDFGSAMFAGKNEITPYLVSRFYRAPEIILGLPYDHPMDIWSVGCCLYELYTGKVLFPGPSNNDMLRLHMELKGPFPKKMLRNGGFIDQHFDQDLNFLATEEDPVTKKTIRRMIHNIKPKDIGTIITSSPGEDPKMLANFKDLMDKIFVLDPEKRVTVSQALSHPFITGK